MIGVLYLYKNHDADLIGLLETVGIKDFRNILKDSLRILTRPGYIPKIPLPKYKPYEGDIERFSIYVSIQSAKDEDIRELISHIKYRQFNSFCKMAMRFYLGVIPTLSSMLDMELIKTVPVYTPSGVIVFSNTVNLKDTSAKKHKSTTSYKRGTDTIQKANKQIQAAVDKNAHTYLQYKEEDIIKSNKREADILVEDSNNYIDTYIDNDLNSMNNSISDNERNRSNSFDEVDVLSLLEGLLG